MKQGPDNSSALSRRLPDTYFLIAGVGLFVFLCTFLVTPGLFETMEVTRSDGGVTEMVDPASFQFKPEAGGAVFGMGFTSAVIGRVFRLNGMSGNSAAEAFRQVARRPACLAGVFFRLCQRCWTCAA